MKYLYTILINVMLMNSLFAQSEDNQQHKDTSLLYQKKSYPALNKYDQKMKFHLSTGASVTSFGNNTIFTKWIAPGMSYQVSPKLNLHFGSLILDGNLNYPSYNSEFAGTIDRNNPTQAFLYISGDYQLNKSIRFRATTFNEIPGNNSNQNSFNFNQVGIDIKVTDNFFISADFINQKGQQPFGIYNNNRFNDANSSFGNGFINNGLFNTFH